MLNLNKAQSASEIESLQSRNAELEETLEKTKGELNAEIERLRGIVEELEGRIGMMEDEFAAKEQALIDKHALDMAALETELESVRSGSNEKEKREREEAVYGFF